MDYSPWTITVFEAKLTGASHYQCINYLVSFSKRKKKSHIKFSFTDSTFPPPLQANWGEGFQVNSPHTIPNVLMELSSQDSLVKTWVLVESLAFELPTQMECLYNYLCFQLILPPPFCCTPVLLPALPFLFWL